MNYLQLPLSTSIKKAFSSAWSNYLSTVSPALAITCVRWASKKASSSKRNTGGNSKGKRLGLKKREGEYAQANQILVRQKMQFRYYPGQYVRTGNDKTLVAQVAGTVHLTKERWHPNHKTVFGKYIAQTLPEEQMLRTFVNIIPEPEVGKFKLVEQI